MSDSILYEDSRVKPKFSTVVSSSNQFTPSSPTIFGDL